MVTPIAVRAQFQQPSDEELKMTADPKAPGAAAVYLNYEEIDNDAMGIRSYSARIKVLAEKGKELATVDIPYLRTLHKTFDLKGRTIHSDGTVVPLTARAEDLMAAKIGEEQVDRVVFTLPSVEVGSILEYSYTLQDSSFYYAPPEWEIQKKYFVHNSHYQLTYPNLDNAPGPEPRDSFGHMLALKNWSRLPAGPEIKRAFRQADLRLTDVPPIPDEDWMPPVETFIYRVQFYFGPLTMDHSMTELTPREYWRDDVKAWSDEVNGFAERSKAIKSAVAGLVAPADSDLDKAKKIYDAVQALDNTDFSREKSKSERKALKVKEVKNADDTWAQKSGSREDIAMLYLAMLRAAGLSAYAAKVVDRDRNVFNPQYISLDQFDSTLVYLTAGDQQILLDPSEKMCPFGTVSWRHSDAGGIAQSAQGASIATTPTQQYKDNVTLRSGDVTLDAQGGVTGTLNLVMTGQAALYWRQQALQNDDAEVKKQFDEQIAKAVPEGVEAHVDHFLGMTDPYANLMAVVNVKGTLGTVTGKRMIISGFLFGSRGSLPFVNEEKRQEPVDMHYAERITDEITLHLPDGMTVEGAPQENKVSWPGHALFAAKAAAGPGQITMSDTLARAFSMLKPEEYQDLRGFYQKVAAADQQQIVLTKAPAAGKGN